MAYQDYRKWISSNEANKSLSFREIFSIFGQTATFRGTPRGKEALHGISGASPMRSSPMTALPRCGRAL